MESVVLLRVTIWTALVFYLVAVLLMLSPRGKASGVARICWTLGCLAYLAHVAAAFHYVHGWSHEHAFAHTEEASGFGPGIFVSYVFTLVWALDVASWWLWPGWYARRPR